MKPRLGVRLLFAGVCLSSGVSWAQVNAPNTAEELFVAGRSAMQAGDYAAACDRFHESDRLEQGLGTALNLGLCEERLGHWVEAGDYYRRVIDTGAADDPRTRIAREQWSGLDERTPRLTVRLAASAPAGTTVLHGALPYDDANLGSALPSDPGAHRFTVQAPGFAARDYEVVLNERDRVELTVAPGAPLVAPALPAHGALAPPEAEALRPAPSEPTPSQVSRAEPDAGRTLGWALVVTGGAAVAAGIATGIVLLNDQAVVESDCDANKACKSTRALNAADQGRALNVLSPVLLFGGAAVAGAGAYFLLRQPGASGSTRLGARISPARAELALVHTF
jgi:hypothetical protein